MLKQVVNAGCRSSAAAFTPHHMPHQIDFILDAVIPTCIALTRVPARCCGTLQPATVLTRRPHLLWILCSSGLRISSFMPWTQPQAPCDGSMKLDSESCLLQLFPTK